jgi:hypothetical protein
LFDCKAESRDPETNAEVPILPEVCASDRSAKLKVVLTHAITLSGTERLAIFRSIKDQEVVSMTAKNGTATEIHEFSGESSLGCLADRSKASLTKSPVGPLGTLLIVMGKGIIQRDYQS